MGVTVCSQHGRQPLRLLSPRLAAALGAHEVGAPRAIDVDHRVAGRTIARYIVDEAFARACGLAPDDDTSMWIDDDAEAATPAALERLAAECLATCRECWGAYQRARQERWLRAALAELRDTEAGGTIAIEDGPLGIVCQRRRGRVLRVIAVRCVRRDGDDDLDDIAVTACYGQSWNRDAVDRDAVTDDDLAREPEAGDLAGVEGQLRFRSVGPAVAAVRAWLLAWVSSRELSSGGPVRGARGH